MLLQLKFVSLNSCLQFTFPNVISYSVSYYLLNKIYSNTLKMAANMSPQEKDELMRTVQAQVALANMQELLSVRFFILTST